MTAFGSNVHKIFALILILVLQEWRTKWRKESNGGHLEDKSAQIGGKWRKMEDICQIGGHWRTLEDNGGHGGHSGNLVHSELQVI